MSFLLALLVLAQVPGGIELDPRLRWFTLETEHFAVHFPAANPPTEEQLALPRELCAVAEQAHGILSPAMEWQPAGRTAVVLADFFDYANGWAAPFPSNTITVLPSLPAADRTGYDDWLATLFIHEYSHILEIDQARGPMAGLRRVLGRLALPNALAPAWLHEGYAVYNETRYTRFGRNRGQEFRLLIDAAARSGSLLGPDRSSSYELRRFPGGNAPYLYGGLFADWLARTRGPGFADTLNWVRSRSLPWMESYALRTLTGSSLRGLWRDWQAGLKPAPAGPQPRRITAEGFSVSAPVWSRTGAEVYYYSATGLEYPCVRAVDSAGTDSRVLCRTLVNGTMALSPDGRSLCFGELRRLDNVYEHSDLVLVDIATGRRQRLTERLRARDPDFAPDTDLVAFVADGNGRNRLCLIDLSTRLVSNLVEPEEPVAFHSPRFSPNGRWLAVGVRRPGGRADIELIDCRTGWSTPVTEDEAVDLNPAWSRTGKFVYFASDRAGGFEVFAFELATGRLFQCTSAGTGVFEPAVSPDNRSLCVTALGPLGQDIATLPIDAARWQAVEPTSSEPEAEPAARPATASRLYYYNPFPSLLPQFWCPLVGLESGLRLGAFTLGWDALQSWRYGLQAGYDATGSSPFIAANCLYNGWWVKPSLALDITLHRQAASVDAAGSLTSFADAHWFALGIDASHDSLLDAAVSAAWTYSNAHTWRFSAAPNEGSVIGLAADHALPLVRSEPVTRAFAYWSRYFGAARRSWSLRVRLAGGTAFGDSAPAATAFRLGPGPAVFGVRGFSGLDIRARTVAAAGLQFRTPLWWVERGFASFPVFLQDVNAALFVEGLTGCPTALDWDGVKSNARLGAGAELRADLLLGHLLPVSVTCGAAAGLAPFGSLQFYGSVSSDLLSGLLERPRSGLAGRLRLPHE